MERVLKPKEAWFQLCKLRAEGDKLRAEGSKLHAEGSKLRAEGSKLHAEGSKLHAEGDKLFSNSVIAAYGGQTPMKWTSTGCIVDSKHTFNFEEPL